MSCKALTLNTAPARLQMLPSNFAAPMATALWQRPRPGQPSKECQSGPLLSFRALLLHWRRLLGSFPDQVNLELMQC